MGFRYGGTAWDGQKWSASMAIRALGEEIDGVTPRPKGTDGTVASKGHDSASPTSDHTPKPAVGTGIVRAIDFSVTTEQGYAIAERIRQLADPRCKYLIHNRRMFSSYPVDGIEPFVWRYYGGSNEHISHVHVSVHDDADDDGSPWGIVAQEQPVAGIMTVSSWAEAAFDKAVEADIVSETHREQAQDPVTLERMLVFLDRAGVLDVRNLNDKYDGPGSQSVTGTFVGTIT